MENQRALYLIIVTFLIIFKTKRLNIKVAGNSNELRTERFQIRTYYSTLNFSEQLVEKDT